jgi:hypothetical protein
MPRISTRTLKIFTSIVLVIGVVMLVAWPTLLGPRPGAEAGLEVNRAYAYRFVAYISTLVGLLVLSGISSLLIMRRVSAEYREHATENMRSLIEAAREDARAKREDGGASG